MKQVSFPGALGLRPVGGMKEHVSPAHGNYMFQCRQWGAGPGHRFSLLGRHNEGKSTYNRAFQPFSCLSLDAARSTSWVLPPVSLPPLPPTPVHGKIVFRETSPWCQRCWGPLIEHGCKSAYRGLESEFPIFAFPKFDFLEVSQCPLQRGPFW